MGIHHDCPKLQNAHAQPSALASATAAILTVTQSHAHYSFPILSKYPEQSREALLEGEDCDLQDVLSANEAADWPFLKDLLLGMPSCFCLVLQPRSVCWHLVSACFLFK